jgi:hypothetical protein
MAASNIFSLHRRLSRDALETANPRNSATSKKDNSPRGRSQFVLLTRPVSVGITDERFRDWRCRATRSAAVGDAEIVFLYSSELPSYHIRTPSPITSDISSRSGHFCDRCSKNGLTIRGSTRMERMNVSRRKTTAHSSGMRPIL